MSGQEAGIRNLSPLCPAFDRGMGPAFRRRRQLTRSFPMFKRWPNGNRMIAECARESLNQGILAESNSVTALKSKTHPAWDELLMLPPKEHDDFLDAIWGCSRTDVSRVALMGQSGANRITRLALTPTLRSA